MLTFRMFIFTIKSAVSQLFINLKRIYPTDEADGIVITDFFMRDVVSNRQRYLISSRFRTPQTLILVRWLVPYALLCLWAVQQLNRLIWRCNLTFKNSACPIPYS